MQHGWFFWFLSSWTILGVVVFIVLLFITAPYGRYDRKGWGPLIPPKWAWLFMEAPASLLMFFYWMTSDKPFQPVPLVFIAIWQVHYVYRAFIYPFRLPAGSHAMPLSMVLFGLVFNGVNTLMNGYGIFWVGTLQDPSWFLDWRFLLGVSFFFLGMYINRRADDLLRQQRSQRPGEYFIPQGGPFRWLSCPNYSGEIFQWCGWAILTWSWPAGTFALWTFVNLGPRIFSHHRWYLRTFPDYPSKRKALLPFLW